jgi:hypothetical protein
MPYGHALLFCCFLRYAKRPAPAFTAQKVTGARQLLIPISTESTKNGLTHGLGMLPLMYCRTPNLAFRENRKIGRRCNQKK